MFVLLTTVVAQWVGLAGTYDAQGSSCAAAYGHEFSPTPRTVDVTIPSDGCYRVEVYRPFCDYAAGSMDVDYCKGRTAKGIVTDNLLGWVPVGVWPFYVANGGRIVHHSAHDATRLVFVNGLEHGCHFQEARLARIHLAADFSQVADVNVLATEAEKLLQNWGDVRVLGVSPGSVVLDVELGATAKVGALAPLCELVQGGPACVAESTVFIQEEAGHIQQVQTAEVVQAARAETTHDDAQVLAPAVHEAVQVLTSAMTFDGQGLLCAGAYGKSISSQPRAFDFEISQDGCYRVEVFQPDSAGCDYSPGALDVHYCKGRVAQVAPGDMNGWIPVGVWPFYVANGGRIVHHSAHDATRLVFVNGLEHGCHFQEARLARIHLAADFSQVADVNVLATEAEKLLQNWGDVRVLGVSPGSVVLDVELGATAKVGALAPLCELVQGGPACVAESTVFIQEKVGNIQQVQTTEAHCSECETRFENGIAVTVICTLALGMVFAARMKRGAKVDPMERAPDAEQGSLEHASAATKPSKDDDERSTATPGSNMEDRDLDGSLDGPQSPSYTCGRAGVSIKVDV